MANQIKQKPLSNLEISSFCGQMAMILKSGISALEGISILLEDAQTPEEKALLANIYDTMLETGRLHPSLDETKVFPDYFLQMIQIGEETGMLDEVMDSLDKHYSREEAISQSIKNALTYPLIMIGMMLLVVIILMTKVMPVFNQVFHQLGREMSGLSRGILLLGNALSQYASVFIGIGIVIILLLVYLTRTKQGRKILLKLGHHFRLSREIYDKMSACRFAGGMSLALRSGLNPERGLEFSENLICDEIFLNKIISCKEMLEQGIDLAEAFKTTGMFTGVYARMVSVAGKAGLMDEVMGQIADRYEEEVDERITSFISVLEPTLVILLSVIVGIILLSVMLPLLGIMAGL